MGHVHRLSPTGWVALRLATYLGTLGGIAFAASAVHWWAWLVGIPLLIAEMIFFGHHGTATTEGDRDDDLPRA